MDLQKLSDNCRELRRQSNNRLRHLSSEQAAQSSNMIFKAYSAVHAILVHRKKLAEAAYLLLIIDEIHQKTTVVN
ncbi:MAG: hypothetical protein JKY70_22595 [Mucilaginibacter sp.]|nr:hypothetical protein [Mucilaginibacter sp.]